MNGAEKDAVLEVRDQSNLAYSARRCLAHAERLAIYAQYNQRVDVRDEAYETMRALREVLREINDEDAEDDALKIVRMASDLRMRLHGAFPGDAKTPLYADLKRFFRLIELKGGIL